MEFPVDALDTVAAFMKEHRLLLVTAESCTAGLIAARLADVPGAGALLDCAFVVYSPHAKQRCVGVRKRTLDRYNLTSEPVAREMARGALRRSRANLAISDTGVVDDTDAEIPAGTQCFAWAFAPPDGEGPACVFSETRRFSGDRHAIRKASAEYALHRIPHYFGLLGAPAAPQASVTEDQS